MSESEKSGARQPDEPGDIDPAGESTSACGTGPRYGRSPLEPWVPLIPNYAETIAAQVQRAALELTNLGASTHKQILDAVKTANSIQVATTPILDIGKVHLDLGPLIEAASWQQKMALRALDFTRHFDFSRYDDLAKLVSGQVSSIVERLTSFEQLRSGILRKDGPGNWVELKDDQLTSLLRLASAGIPVSWVPRAGILTELLGTDEDAWFTVLRGHKYEILADCRSAIAEVTGEPYGPLAVYLDEALAVFEDGRDAAAQALAANIVDTVLREAVVEPVKRGYYQRVKDEIEDAPLALLPWAVTHWPVLPALTTFSGGEESPPETFNRHATAHAVGNIQYSHTNALLVVMLATSVLREAQHGETYLFEADNDPAPHGDDS